ncbi:GNAT family N-acetyltransferase [Novosphingobium cyanobacteriorum]|uniref:GNAT family N-acetyltransferase n=1 Tax=Novosphingobium cyanobacteriorum TaxID=3024215 RepID=A0ABT6CH07_9SPHN|nr:GNAT family N-acetyltransferase [Novosphingobium cyanobacteriorum]MDF8333215.1 GNAT family N-acetyltransferase [Novosphingobium cyanobacteriorum]
MKAALRALAGLLVRDYRINWIYAAEGTSPLLLRPDEAIRPVDEALRNQLAQSRTAKVANSLSYANAGLEGLALLRDGDPLCVAHFAQGAQYGRAATWPLRSGEVALMDIATEDAARGQGLAPRMIAAASRHFLGAGALRMIAFIWWSNTPSVRAFRKAGWRRIGLSLEWQGRGPWRKLHIPL